MDQIAFYPDASVVAVNRLCVAQLLCCSTFHAPGARDTDWSCANSYVYAIRGYPGKREEPLVNVTNARKLKTAVVEAGRREGLAW